MPHNVENILDFWGKKQMLKKWLQVLCGETAWVVSDHMASGPGEQNIF